MQCQMVYEEHFVTKYDIPSLQAIGFEGIYGLIIVIISLFFYFHSISSKLHHHLIIILDMSWRMLLMDLL